MCIDSQVVKLEATAIRFFSEGDESAFFAWIENLPCVKRVEGKGQTLYVSVNSPAVDENSLRELLAIFHRYGVDGAQLVAFDREEFADWFRSRDSYWYADVFGNSATKD